MDEEDGVVFDPASVEAVEIKSQDEYAGARVTMLAYLESARIPIQADVGYGDSVVPPPREEIFPGLLDYPGAILRCYAPETAVAEKLEALVKLGLINSRIKGYYDFRCLARLFPFEGRRLRETIPGTFARRSTPLPQSTPIGLSEIFWMDPNRQAAWRAFWKKSVRTDPMVSLEETVSFATGFLLPPIMEPSFSLLWKPGGPWMP